MKVTKTEQVTEAQSLTDKVTKKISRIVLIVIITIFLLILALIGYFFYALTPVNSSSDEAVTFVLESGWGSNKVADELEKQNLIKNALIFKIYVKLNHADSFQAGTYNLTRSMNASELIESFVNGKNVIINSVTITFVEGKRFPYYAKKIVDEFGYSYDEIIAKTSDPEYLNKLIKKYWFIENDILNEDLYYPLEGYIFPDTYQFKKEATIEEIIEKMLDGMDEKLSNYKKEIELSGLKIHDLLTLASMVELEAVTPEDRLVLAGVFNNRIKSGWTLGSDVTTYYAVKKEMTESLTMSDLNGCNAYNTRGVCVKGLPVGPICAPSYSSITASITPDETEYYYFVADSHNKLYFGVTESDHQKNISDLKKQGLWPE